MPSRRRIRQARDLLRTLRSSRDLARAGAVVEIEGSMRRLAAERTYTAPPKPEGFRSFDENKGRINKRLYVRLEPAGRNDALRRNTTTCSLQAVGLNAFDTDLPELDGVESDALRRNTTMCALQAVGAKCIRYRPSRLDGVESDALRRNATTCVTTSSWVNAFDTDLLGLDDELQWPRSPKS